MVSFSFKRWLEDTGQVFTFLNGEGPYSEIPSKYQSQERKDKKKREKKLHILRKHKL